MAMRGREALERALEYITAGQWCFRDYGGEALANQHDSTQGRITGKGGVIIAQDVGRENALFIIWAPERFRDLLDQVDKMKKALTTVATHYDGPPEEQCQFTVRIATRTLEEQAEWESPRD